MDNKGMDCVGSVGHFKLTDLSDMTLEFHADCAFAFSTYDKTETVIQDVVSPDDNWSFEYTAVIAASLLAGFFPIQQDYIVGLARKLQNGELKQITAEMVVGELDRLADLHNGATNDSHTTT